MSINLQKIMYAIMHSEQSTSIEISIIREAVQPMFPLPKMSPSPSCMQICSSNCMTEYNTWQNKPSPLCQKGCKELCTQLCGIGYLTVAPAEALEVMSRSQDQLAISSKQSTGLHLAVPTNLCSELP
ncbi:hypothetical protein LOAG_01551 [Loa loa]|uniref:Uncharacterized protein n=1 Tax=Loa loa TaxID=7209 RepID=A0A1S0U8L5_LOALO|nr:hypothetical protein LOAG_01551 [Loa loa]EFO26926.2 hypothetical protein LOAG_01551 [Loa loa]